MHVWYTQHCFVLTFANKDHRDYYIEKDPAHLEFVRFLTGKVEDAFVFDYEVGSFGEPGVAVCLIAPSYTELMHVNRS